MMPGPGDGCKTDLEFFQEFADNATSPWSQQELRQLQQDRRIGHDEWGQA